MRARQVGAAEQQGVQQLQRALAHLQQRRQSAEAIAYCKMQKANNAKAAATSAFACTVQHPVSAQQVQRLRHRKLPAHARCQAGTTLCRPARPPAAVAAHARPHTPARGGTASHPHTTAHRARVFLASGELRASAWPRAVSENSAPAAGAGPAVAWLHRRCSGCPAPAPNPAWRVWAPAPSPGTTGGWAVLLRYTNHPWPKAFKCRLQLLHFHSQNQSS